MPDLAETRATNAQLNHLEMEQRQIVLESRPRMLFVELTRSCNLACPMCRPEILSGSRLAMSESVLDLIETELFPYAEVVDVRGFGESTLDNRLLGLVDRVVGVGARAKIITNLSTRTPSYWDELGRREFLVGVSIEAAHAELYESIRLGAKYERVLRNLEALRNAQIRRGGKNDAYFGVVVSELNLAEIVPLVELAASHEIPMVALNPLFTRDPVTNYPTVGVAPENSEMLRHALREAYEVAARKNVELRVGSNLVATCETGGYDQCLHPWSYVFVRYDGGVGFCDHLINNEPAIFGHLGPQSFMDIWNGPPYRQLRTDHVNHDFERLANLGLECDWCYKNRYVDGEWMIEPGQRPMVVSPEIINALAPIAKD